MTAEIIQFRPRPNPTRDERTLEQQAIEIMNVALMGEPAIGVEPVVYLEMDTSPAEYTAPLDDPA